MRNFLLLTILAVSVSVTFSQTSFAVCTEGPPDTFTCDTNPPNPDPDGIQQNGNNNDITVDMSEGSAIDTSLQPGLGNDGIDTGSGNNTFNLIGSSIIGQDVGIDAGTGVDILTMRNARVMGVTDDGIRLSPGDDIADIKDSVISTIENTVLNTGPDDDTVTVSGSEIKVLTASGNDVAVQLGEGNDSIFVETSVIQGGSTLFPIADAINLFSEDDVLTIGNGVELLGIVTGGQIIPGNIECGDGFDTIIFAMDVPPDQLNRLTGELVLADPDGDTIVINNLTYTWENCELLVNELVPVLMTRPIPTLSEWGLIAMAGVLGITALLVMRRKTLLV